MKKKLTVFLITSFLILGVYSPAGAAEYDANFCQQFKNQTKIWWDGIELKTGQIGRLTVKADTPLYKVNGEKRTYSRTLKAGEFYRIYAFKPGMLSVGGGYYVDRDKKISYSTPSKTKLRAVSCVNVWKANTPVNYKSYTAKALWIEIQSFKNNYKTMSQEEFHKKLYEFKLVLKNSTLSEYERAKLEREIMDLRKLIIVTIDKLIVEFANGEQFLLIGSGTNMLGTDEEINHQVYLKTQYLNVLLGLLDKQYYVERSSLPGGLKGTIQTGYVNPAIEKIYLDMNDINSEWYEKISLKYPKSNKTLVYGDIYDRFESYTYKRNPYSINDLYKLSNVNGTYTLTNGILVLKLNDFLPK
ncbi:hypothetical protein ACFWGC_29220 [Cytobacillus pseudoceanisediminis]|uniref:hypothetical protein n=1 Tax=Cytobacillus pseudoceanisediminis TaxID=3051614 RepID=UPI0036556E2A